MRLFLRQARRRERSIVNLCEHLGYRSAAQKELIRTPPALKIVNNEIIFAPSEETRAEHS